MYYLNNKNINKIRKNTIKKINNNKSMGIFNEEVNENIKKNIC